MAIGASEIEADSLLSVVPLRKRRTVCAPVPHANVADEACNANAMRSPRAEARADDDERAEGAETTRLTISDCTGSNL